MQPPRFRYVRAESLDHLLALLAEYGDAAQILAGGQSLMPLLNMRLAAPEAVIDISGLRELAGISSADGVLRIGALARHRELMASDAVARDAPLIAAATPYLAHPAVRNRGTFGGSIALADPAAELPACCLALGATFVLTSARGERRVSADAFFRGLYETAREPDEALVAAELPASEGRAFAFGELARRHGDFALAGLAAARGAGGLRLAFFGIADRPLLAPRAAARLAAGEVAGAAAALAGELACRADMHASAKTRLRLAQTLLRRAAPELAE